MLKRIIIIFVIVIFCGTILFFFNPENSIWFPKCPFYILTGLQCPSCGIQRALHHLLQLQFKEAFWYNPFLIISIPYAVALLLSTWIMPGRCCKLRTLCTHPYTIDIYVILMIAWWIARNILKI